MQKYGFCFLNVMLLQIVATHFVGECEYLTEYLPHYFNLLAALLADRQQPQGPIYRALISVYIHKMMNRNVFAMKRIYVFDNVKIRIWQWKNTGTMNRSLRLAECKLGVFVGECGYFTECLPHYFNLLAALLADRQLLQGPIYRALISVYIHKMGNRNVCVIK